MEGERGSDATERAPLKAKEGSATDLSAGRLVGLQVYRQFVKLRPPLNEGNGVGRAGNLNFSCRERAARR